MLRRFRYAFLFFTFFSILKVEAQYNEIGFMVGVSRYKGELSSHMMRTDFLHPPIGFMFRHNWDRRWSWKMELNFGKVSGDDAKAKNEFELDRNLSFYSSIW